MRLLEGYVHSFPACFLGLIEIRFVFRISSRLRLCWVVVWVFLSSLLRSLLSQHFGIILILCLFPTSAVTLAFLNFWPRSRSLWPRDSLVTNFPCSVNRWSIVSFHGAFSLQFPLSFAFALLVQPFSDYSNFYSGAPFSLASTTWLKSEIALLFLPCLLSGLYLSLFLIRLFFSSVQRIWFDFLSVFSSLV